MEKNRVNKKGYSAEIKWPPQVKQTTAQNTEKQPGNNFAINTRFPHSTLNQFINDQFPQRGW